MSKLSHLEQRNIFQVAYDINVQSRTIMTFVTCDKILEVDW